MTAPALLMRNTTDDPTWTSFIYHDHVSWFPGGAYVVEKLFREHFAETYLASTSGTFRDIDTRGTFFSDISQMKPEGWQPGTVDAIATASADARRIVVKAVNYQGSANTLLVHLQGSRLPASATVTIYTITAPARYRVARAARPDQARRADDRIPSRPDHRSGAVYGRRHRDRRQIGEQRTRADYRVPSSSTTMPFAGTV
jgi:hypothetical protein